MILVSVNSFFDDSGIATGLDKGSINSRAVMEDKNLLVFIPLNLEKQKKIIWHNSSVAFPFDIRQYMH